MPPETGWLGPFYFLRLLWLWWWSWPRLTLKFSVSTAYTWCWLAMVHAWVAGSCNWPDCPAMWMNRPPSLRRRKRLGRGAYLQGGATQMAPPLGFLCLLPLGSVGRVDPGVAPPVGVCAVGRRDHPDPDLVCGVCCEA